MMEEMQLDSTSRKQQREHGIWVFSRIEFTIADDTRCWRELHILQGLKCQTC
jgi:hypothetical protein